MFQAIELLSPRERKILEMKYIEKHKWCKISEDFGVTQTRLKQIADNAILKLIYTRIREKEDFEQANK